MKILSTFDQNLQGYHGFLQYLLSKYKEANSDLACSAFIFKDEFHTCIQMNFMQIYVLFIDAVETIWKIRKMKNKRSMEQETNARGGQVCL